MASAFPNPSTAKHAVDGADHGFHGHSLALDIEPHHVEDQPPARSGRASTAIGGESRGADSYLQMPTILLCP